MNLRLTSVQKDRNHLTMTTKAWSRDKSFYFHPWQRELSENDSRQTRGIISLSAFLLILFFLEDHLKTLGDFWGLFFGLSVLLNSPVCQRKSSRIIE